MAAISKIYCMSRLRCANAASSTYPSETTVRSRRPSGTPSRCLASAAAGVFEPANRRTDLVRSGGEHDPLGHAALVVGIPIEVLGVAVHDQRQASGRVQQVRRTSNVLRACAPYVARTNPGRGSASRCPARMRGQFKLELIRVGGACGPPPPVAAALASSLRAPSRGDPPLRGRGVSWLPPGRLGSAALRALRKAMMRRFAGVGRGRRAGSSAARGPAASGERSAARIGGVSGSDPARANGATPAQSLGVRPHRCVRAVGNLRPDHAAGGRRGKERAASLRAQQRLAAGGRRLPRPGSVRA